MCQVFMLTIVLIAAVAAGNSDGVTGYNNTKNEYVASSNSNSSSYTPSNNQEKDPANSGTPSANNIEEAKNYGAPYVAPYIGHYAPASYGCNQTTIAELRILLQVLRNIIFGVPGYNEYSPPSYSYPSVYPSNNYGAGPYEQASYGYNQRSSEKLATLLNALGGALLML